MIHAHAIQTDLLERVLLLLEQVVHVAQECLSLLGVVASALQLLQETLRLLQSLDLGDRLDAAEGYRGHRLLMRVVVHVLRCLVVGARGLRRAAPPISPLVHICINRHVPLTMLAICIMLVFTHYFWN